MLLWPGVHVGPDHLWAVALFGVLRVCVPDTAFSDAEGVVQGLGLDSGGNGPILEGDDEGLVILPA